MKRYFFTIKADRTGRVCLSITLCAQLGHERRSFLAAAHRDSVTQLLSGGHLIYLDFGISVLH